jgi:hypothetical protein
MSEALKGQEKERKAKEEERKAKEEKRKAKEEHLKMRQTSGDTSEKWRLAVPACWLQ